MRQSTSITGSVRLLVFNAFVRRSTRRTLLAYLALFFLSFSLPSLLTLFFTYLPISLSPYLPISLASFLIFTLTHPLLFLLFNSSKSYRSDFTPSFFQLFSLSSPSILSCLFLPVLLPFFFSFMENSPCSCPYGL